MITFSKKIALGLAVILASTNNSCITLATDNEYVYSSERKISYNEWNALTIYDYGDQVIYNNNLYEAKWWTQGQEPYNDDNENNAWKVKELNVNNNVDITKLPVFRSIEEAEAKNITQFILKNEQTSPSGLVFKSASGNHSVATLKNSVSYTNQYFGLHPQLSTYMKTAGYYLGADKSTGTFSVSLNAIIISVSAAYDRVGSGGRIFKADQNRLSALGVIGTVTQNTYEIKTYDAMDHLISTTTSKTSNAVITEYKAVYK